MKCYNFLCESHDVAWSGKCRKALQSGVKYPHDCDDRKTYNRLVTSNWEWFEDRFMRLRDEYYGRQSRGGIVHDWKEIK